MKTVNINKETYEKVKEYINQKIKQKKVKSFYVYGIITKFNIEFSEAFAILNELCKEGLLTIKYEIRCLNDLSVLITLGDFDSFIGSEITCYECGENITITIDNIYIVKNKKTNR